MVKRTLIIAALTLLLTGCVGRNVTTYEEPDTGKSIDVKVEDFIKLRKICSDSSGCRVYLDMNTDVLYYYEHNAALNMESKAITPIMKPDGTCLTYSEWKQSKFQKVE